jgi:hypothetical protein
VVANSAVKIRVPFVFLLIHLQGVFFISASMVHLAFVKIYTMKRGC